MPASEMSSRAFARSSFSCSRPMAANTGLAWVQVGVGAVLCATIQIEQEELSLWLGWLWVASATAAHSMSERQNHVSHRPVNRMRSCIGIDSHQLITVASRRAMPVTLVL